MSKCSKCGNTISEKQAKFTLFHRGGEKCSKCSEQWVRENRPEELAKVINNSWKGGEYAKQS